MVILGKERGGDDPRFLLLLDLDVLAEPGEAFEDT
jgi:hypothetical protein